jgi:murein L,D-transpeptidase YafK
MRRFGWFILLFCGFQLSGQKLSEKKVIISESAKTKLEMAVRDAGLSLGDSVFIRAFKSENQLELWIIKDTAYQLFRKMKRVLGLVF